VHNHDKYQFDLCQWLDTFREQI